MAVAAFISAPENSTLYNNVEYWVSPTGDDTASGSQALPWLTYARAAAEAMKYKFFSANVSMIIHLVGVSGTTYTGVTIHDIAMGQNAFLAIIGGTTDTLLAATVATAGTSAAVATGAGCTEAQIVVAAAGWTVDAYQGKTCRILTGAATGVRATIASNTATMLRLADNQFTYTTGGAAIVAGDTFTIEEPGITLAGSGSPDFENITPAISTASGVILCNLKTTSSVSARNASLQTLGVEIAAAGYLYGEPGDSTIRMGLAVGFTTTVPPVNIYALLGMPSVAGSSYHWYAWGGQDKGVLYVYDDCQASTNGAVLKDVNVAKGGYCTLGGGIMLGTALAQGIGSALDIPGGGAQFRVASTGEGAYGGCIQVAQQAKLRINRAAFACAGRCIVVAQNSQALLGTNGDVLITGAPTVARSALLLSGNENTALFRTAMLLAGNGVGFDWEMGVLQGVAADILFNYSGGDVANPNGDRIGRLGV
jgi:hypothetical protein